MKTTTNAAQATYTIIETTMVSGSPKQAAEIFGACLAADRGYSSSIVRIDARTFDCVASDGRAIRFQRTAHLRVVR